MPTLFISYKRGTSGIATLMTKLREKYYRLWYDKDDIHTGENWRESINRGVDRCDALIVSLTPDACRSEFVKHEVQRAIAQNKRIFPVKMAAIDESTDPALLGLTDIQFTDFATSDPTDWQRAFDKLISDMERHEILRTSPHDIRKDRNSDEYALHQKYLNTLIARIGRLRLSAINPDHTDADGAPLEAVYVPLPTKQTLSVEIQDYKITDWWIDEAGKAEKGILNRVKSVEDYPPTQRTRPAAKHWENDAALAALVDGRQIRLDAQYDEVKTAKEKGKRSYGQVKYGVHPEELRLFAHDVAAATKRLVILGGPGSGKSTFVKHLALCLAGEGLQNPMREANLAALGRWPHGPLTPIYVELRAFVSSAHFPESDPPTAAHLWDYIRADILGEDLADYAPQLDYDLHEGHALLVLDGLDEVPYPRKRGGLAARQEQLRTFAQALNDTYGKSRILVASRPYAYEGWSLPGFSDVRLDAFGDDERQALAANLYRAAGDDDETATDKAKRLNAALQDIDPELKDRPLFVTLMATVFAAGESEGLPTRKGALYRESILLLLDRWTRAKAEARPLTELLGDSTRDDLIERLAQMAYEVHEQLGDNPGTPEIPRELLARHILEMEWEDPSVRATQIISYLSENAGVLVSPGHAQGDHVFHFAHRTFQEYLAARHIMATCDQSFDPLRELMATRPQLWRVPGRLVADVLVDDDQFKDKELWGLVDDLLPDDPPDAIDADDPRWWLVWLCARYVDEQDFPEPKGRGDKAIRDNLVAWLVKLVQTPFALEPPERAACGRALGLLGDPRPGVGVKDGLPDIDWVTIPGGEFIYGDDNKDGYLSFAPPADQQMLTLPTFEISRYPVTYAQFQAFIDDSEGFQDSRWWEGLAIPDGHKDAPGDQDFKYWNHPRENVSWYDAMAFCRWLSWRYEQAGLFSPLPAQRSGEGPGVRAEIRLPTEFEWERAARGTEGRTYPYKGEFDAAKGNVGETDIGQTSAVGIFPNGASPDGILDMSGNVWDWCLTDYSNPQERVGDEDIRSNSRRVLRGGSWYDLSLNARAAARFARNPDLRGYGNGFRLCCVRAPSLKQP